MKRKYLFLIISFGFFMSNCYPLTYLQVGVFAQKPNADRAIRNLTNNGFTVALGDERGYTWVYAGPFPDSQINYMRQRLSTIGYKTSYIRKNPRIVYQITDLNYELANVDITEAAREREKKAKEEREYQEAMRDKKREQEYEDLKRQIEIERMRNELEDIKSARKEAMQDKMREQTYEDLKRQIEIEDMRNKLEETKFMRAARSKQAADFAAADLKRIDAQIGTIHAENDATRYVAEGMKNNLSKEDKNVYVVKDNYKVIDTSQGNFNLIVIILASLFSGILVSVGVFWIIKSKRNP